MMGIVPDIVLPWGGPINVNENTKELTLNVSIDIADKLSIINDIDDNNKGSWLEFCKHLGIDAVVKWNTPLRIT